MYKEEIILKISEMYKFVTVNPFPYEEISKIKAAIEKDFVLVEDESLNADFNEYCTVIVGTTNYVLKGNVEQIPKRQIELLNKGFFERFPQYNFFESSLDKYPDFQSEYNNHEKLRRLLLNYLQFK